jgi:ribosome-associated protein
MRIPDNEITINFSSSSGKGGQNVNKVESRVQVSWNVDRSNFFNYEQKQQIKQVLKNKLTNEGNIQVVAEAERSQLQNRMQAVERLNTLVQKALHKAKKRVPTKPTWGAKLKRLTNKRTVSILKKSRKIIED